MIDLKEEICFLLSLGVTGTFPTGCLLAGLLAEGRQTEWCGFVRFRDSSCGFR